MKKILVLVFVGLVSLSLFACSAQERLSVLNWGEYINEDLVDAFEEEYNCKVNIAIAESNELMEQKILAGTTSYDIVIPSDYMIEKLYDGGYLQAIDLTQLSNFNQTAFLDGVNGIMDKMFLDNPEITNSYTISIPYFWGVFGIMYNKSVSGLTDYIETNSWSSVFGPEPTGMSRALRVGMYDVPRFAYSASLLYADETARIAPNNAALNVYSAEYLTLTETILAERDYYEWGTDILKKDIEEGILDLGFVYVGDFFDTYLIACDTANATTAAEAEAATANIGVFVPQETIAFYDGMVIPTSAKNLTLAHKFINYFLDADVAYENSGIVGYTTTLKATYDMIYEATKGDLVRQAMVQNNPYDPSKIVDFIGTPLIAFSNNDTDNIASMINRVKATAN